MLQWLLNVIKFLTRASTDNEQDDHADSIDWQDTELPCDECGKVLWCNRCC